MGKLALYRLFLFVFAISLNTLLIAQPLAIGPEKIKSVDSQFRISFPSSDPGAIIIVAQGGRPVFKKAYSVDGIRFTQFFPGYGPERFNKKVSAIIPPKPVPGIIDSNRLVKYAGIFEQEFGDRAKIIIEKGQLYMENSVIGTKTQLHWISGNIFWVKETDMQVIFDSNAKNVISGVKYFNGFQEISMKRIEELY